MKKLLSLLGVIGLASSGVSVVSCGEDDTPAADTQPASDTEQPVDTQDSPVNPEKALSEVLTTEVLDGIDVANEDEAIAAIKAANVSLGDAKITLTAFDSSANTVTVSAEGFTGSVVVSFANIENIDLANYEKGIDLGLPLLETDPNSVPDLELLEQDGVVVDLGPLIDNTAQSILDGFKAKNASVVSSVEAAYGESEYTSFKWVSDTITDSSAKLGIEFTATTPGGIVLTGWDVAVVNFSISSDANLVAENQFGLNVEAIEDVAKGGQSRHDEFVQKLIDNLDNLTVREIQKSIIKSGQDNGEDLTPSLDAMDSQEDKDLGTLPDNQSQTIEDAISDQYPDVYADYEFDGSPWSDVHFVLGTITDTSVEVQTVYTFTLDDLVVTGGETTATFTFTIDQI